MVSDDDRSRAEELPHHAVAGREPGYIVGNFENDSGAFEADVVVRRVAECDQDVTEVHAGAAQTQTHLAGPERPSRLGPRPQDNVPGVERAVTEGGQPPRAEFDEFGALDSFGAHQTGGKTRAGTECELGFVPMGGFGDDGIDPGPVVDVGQRDEPWVLCLCAPQQSPHGGLAQIADTLGWLDRNGAVGEYYESRIIMTITRQPTLDPVQHVRQGSTGSRRDGATV